MKRRDLIVVHTFKIKLNAIWRALFWSKFIWHLHPGVFVQFRSHIVVVRPTVTHATRYFGNLGAHQSGRHIAKTQIVERQFVLPAGKGLFKLGAIVARAGLMLLPIVLIGTGHDHCPRHQIRVIGDQNTAFARIDQLVGLERETANFTNRADVLSIPGGAQRMGCILDDRDALRVTERHDRVHIGRVTPHVADDHRVYVAQLCLKIRDIDAIVLADFAKHRLIVRMHDRRRHSGKREAWDQHPCVFGQAKRFKRQEQRGRARGHCERVFRPQHL